MLTAKYNIHDSSIVWIDEDKKHSEMKREYALALSKQKFPDHNPDDFNFEGLGYAFTENRDAYAFFIGLRSYMRTALRHISENLSLHDIPLIDNEARIIPPKHSSGADAISIKWDDTKMFMSALTSKVEWKNIWEPKNYLDTALNEDFLQVVQDIEWFIKVWYSALVEGISSEQYAQQMSDWSFKMQKSIDHAKNNTINPVEDISSKLKELVWKEPGETQAYRDLIINSWYENPFSLEEFDRIWEKVSLTAQELGIDITKDALYKQADVHGYADTLRGLSQTPEQRKSEEELMRRLAS